MKSKIFILTISCLALLIVLFSCKKKNAVTDNNPPNKPSTPFFITETNLIGDNITFKVTAIDPDDDSIAARFDWGDGDTSGWSDFVPSGDTMWGTHCYNSINTYNVRAQIKDSKETVTDWSEAISIAVQDSAWTLVWTCVNPSAPWSGRFGLKSVIFDNMIWIIGGWDDNCTTYSTNDVWHSNDGANWTQVTNSAGWSERHEHTSVVFDNKIWVLGGASRYPKNDIWWSTDGVNWTCATEAAPWSPRYTHTSVVFDNRMWIMGGHYVGAKADVWSSTDGTNWTCATDSAKWVPRKLHSSVIFNEKIWVIGGCEPECTCGLYDVWHSRNGILWDCSIEEAEWPRRGYPSVVYENKIFLLGGGDNEIWYSKEGAHWYKANCSNIWPRRDYFTAVVFDNKIWVLGGWTDGKGNLNDVWYGEIVHGKR